MCPFLSHNLFLKHINNYMQKKPINKHTQSLEWQVSSEWLALLIPDVTQQCECVCVFLCMLTVINYLSHAGDLLRLLITSWTRPTGGWFSCTNRESISVWGLVYLCTCTYVTVCARASVKCEETNKVSLNVMILAWSGFHQVSHCSPIHLKVS